MHPERLLDCRSCNKISIPPIFQCNNGHLICSDCNEKLENCPTCNHDLPEQRIRNMILEELTKDIEFPCRNRKMGCKARMKHSDFALHKWDCPFEELPICENTRLVSGCSDLTRRCDLVNHLRNSHPEITGAEAASIDIFQEIPDDMSGNFILSHHYLSYLDQVIFLHSFMDEKLGSFVWIPFIAASSTTANSFVARVKLMSLNNGSSIEWCGRVFGVNETSSEALVNKAIFSLPKALLRAYGRITDSNRVEWKIQFSVEEVEPETLDSLEQMITYARKEVMDHNCSSSNVLKSVILSQDEPSPYFFQTSTEDIGDKAVHEAISCNNCGAKPLIGNRYKCMECEDYDLCETCEKEKVHDKHVFLRIANQEQQEQMLRYFRRVIYTLC